MTDDIDCPNYKMCINSEYAPDGNTKIPEHKNIYKRYSGCIFCNSIHIYEICCIGQQGSELGITLHQCMKCKMIYEYK